MLVVGDQGGDEESVHSRDEFCVGARSQYEIVVTDTIPLNEEARACDKIRQLSVAEMLAETMRRISDEESVSSLYVD